MSVPQLIQFEDLDSTMFEAERQIGQGRSGQFVVLTKMQTRGHGRHGRGWDSPAGNVYCTIAVPHSRRWPADYGLTFGAALAIADTLKQFGVPANEISLKWPNDPLVNDRKIGGVLVNRSTANNYIPSYSLVGIGINLVSFPDDTFFPATCLSQIGITGITALEACRSLVSNFNRRLDQWLEAGFAAYIEEYRAGMYAIGRDITVALDPARRTVVVGVNLGIDDTGALRIQLPNGDKQIILLGDVLPAL